MAISLKNAAAAAVAYVQYAVNNATVVFLGTEHNDMTKDQLILRSDAPVKTKASYGNRRSSVKLLRTVTVSNPDGTSSAKEMKFELVTSVPVGVTNAQVKECFARISAFAADEQLMTDVVLSGKVQH